MTAIGLMLSPSDRERLLARMAELGETDRLIRERNGVRPAPPPVPVMAPRPLNAAPCGGDSRDRGSG